MSQEVGHSAHGLPSRVTTYYADIKTVHVDSDGALRLYRRGLLGRKRQVGFHPTGRWDGVCLSEEHEAGVSMPLPVRRAA